VKIKNFYGRFNSFAVGGFRKQKFSEWFNVLRTLDGSASLGAWRLGGGL